MLPISPKIIIPIVVETVDRIFKFAKTRPNISSLTFSCINMVLDVLNNGRAIPEHSINMIYRINLFAVPKRQMNAPNKAEEYVISFSLLSSLNDQIKSPPSIVPNDQTNSLIAKAFTLSLNFKFTRIGVKKAGADIKK